MSLLLDLVPFEKFGVVVGGQKAFLSPALVWTLELDLKVGQS